MKKLCQYKIFRVSVKCSLTVALPIISAMGMKLVRTYGGTFNIQADLQAIHIAI